MKKVLWQVLALLLVASMLLAACGSTAATEAPASGASFPYPAGGALEEALKGTHSGKTVTVDGAFEGNDPDGVKFAESMKAFEEATGIKVNYIGNKEFEATISVRVDAGDAPDIVDFPQPGKAAQFVASGNIVPVSEYLSADWLAQQYNQSWRAMVAFDGVIWSYLIALKWVSSIVSMARAWFGIQRKHGMRLVIRSPKPGKI